MFSGNFTNSLSNAQAIEGKNFDAYHGQDKISVYSWGHVYEKSETTLAELFYSLYRKKGLKAFSEIDGSYTFILVTPDTLMIGRDHHGTSHQVYYNATHFASSLTLLMQTEGFHAQPNYHALSTFLSCGYIATPQSSFANVQKLGAGEVLCFQANKTTVIRLFETQHIKPSYEKMDLEELSEQYGKLHSEAIRKRIEGKKSVGILLSGGYDSGSNLVALRHQYEGEIRSFSIGFKGDSWSELPLAKCMSDTFNTKHEVYEIDGSEISALPEIVRHLGDPFVEGGLMVNYSAMKLVSGNKPEILLGGDGSDQYFGTTGREIALNLFIRKFGLKPATQMVNKILSHTAFDKDNRLYKVKFHTDKILNILDGDLFGIPSSRLSELLQDKSFLPAISNERMFNSFDELYTQHAYQTDLAKTINQVILFKASKLSELFGNQMAFPFMDLTLYHFMQKLPVSFKCRGNSLMDIAKGRATAKFLMKYHYKPQLPTEITSKKKQGGFAPMPLFFDNKKRFEEISEVILTSGMCGNFLKRDAVERFLKTYKAEASAPASWFWYRQNKAIQLFNMYTLAIWWETFVSPQK